MDGEAWVQNQSPSPHRSESKVGSFATTLGLIEVARPNSYLSKFEVLVLIWLVLWNRKGVALKWASKKFPKLLRKEWKCAILNQFFALKVLLLTIFPQVISLFYLVFDIFQFFCLKIWFYICYTNYDIRNVAYRSRMCWMNLWFIYADTEWFTKWELCSVYYLIWY